ncbi:MAG: hypothetical protein ACE5JI_13415, partial [Acidobacteriota bacterium]
EDWFRVGGGDGFYTQVDPRDPTTVYVESQNGNLGRLSLKTTERKTIRPVPKEGEARYRFDWNSPILISPHDSRTIYYGGNHLFRSADRGDSWTKSPDLTRNQDRDEMPIMGVMVEEKTLSRHDGIATFGQIITLSESPLRQGLLYVGTDDGNLQVSRGGGETWKDVAERLRGVPDGTYVSRVLASAHAEGRVYVTLDGHRNDDYGVYVYVSEDFGESWRSLASTLPEGHTLNVIREHPRQENLLFVGGELGAYVSFNRGREWHRLEGEFPTVPVDDIAIHPRENDLILGTHGRSIWILDDMTPLEKLSEEVLASELHLFDIRDAMTYRIHNHKGSTGHKVLVAPNPPEGALIYYYLKSEPEENQAVQISILDGAGTTIRELKGPQERGLNRTNWDLRYEPPVPQTGQGGFFRPPPGPRVLSGEYTVRVSVGGHEESKTVRVKEDPRIQISAADRRLHHRALLRLSRLIASMDRGHTGAADLLEQVKSLQESLKQSEEVAEIVETSVQSVMEKLSQAERELSRNEGRRRFFSDGKPPPLFVRLTRLYRALDGYTEAPGARQQDRIEALSRELAGRLDHLNTLIEEDIPALNRTIQENGVPRINPGKKVEAEPPRSER